MEAGLAQVEKLREESREHKRESARQRKLSRLKAQQAAEIEHELAKRGVTVQIQRHRSGGS